MAHTRTLSHVLWSTVVGVGVLAGGCGDDDDRVGKLPDAPAGPPIADVAAALATSTQCGVQSPASANLMISNTGGTELVISGAEASGGFSVTSTLPLTIPARSQGMLAVRPPAAVVGTDRAGNVKSGTLTLTTNESSSTRTIALTAAVRSNVELTNQEGAPISLAFTSPTSSCPAPKTVYIKNTGTTPVTFGRPTASGRFLFDGFTSGTIAAGGMEQTTYTLHIDDQLCSGNATVSYSLTGEACGASTLSLPATFSISQASGCFCSANV